ncbi:MAG: HPr family phosphocarrier protein [Sporomusa sp.]
MQSFTYTIKDSTGIHARPAGLLAKMAKKFNGVVTLSKDGKTVDLSKVIALMAMGVGQGDVVTIGVTGEGEEATCEEIRRFFEGNL